MMFTLPFIAYTSLRGTANKASTEGASSSDQTFDDETIRVTPQQHTPKEYPYQPVDDPSMASETPHDEQESTIEQFLATDGALCATRLAEPQFGLVTDVLDASSLLVLIKGRPTKVKFIGIETTSLHQGIKKQALLVNRSLIGQTVALVRDVSDTDAEGRLLRYAFTEDTFINLYLLENGLATVLNNSPDQACVETFTAAQEHAKRQELGAWERLKPNDWREWPVVPVIRENAIEIYLRGLEEGRDSQSFSIVGDCQSIPNRLFRRINWAEFSLPPQYEYLQTTVDHFRLVWSRPHVTVDLNMVAASMFSYFWTDLDRCNPSEIPLECEFRLNNPSILLISIGSNQKPGDNENFDLYMRKIVAYSIEHNVLPIIATKADPTEEGFPLNQIMAQIAYDYDIPLWNLWAAVQDLPHHGLDPDDHMEIHLTSEGYSMKRITGIQVLHAVLTAAQR
ncbi:MAG: hypothetical protein GTO14_22305 [Anaerolineales bacterium]|nr:hypothetical protein [Anaerolineales bacterium]